MAVCRTQTRLLASACEVFAAKGFQNASVTEICEKANANIAAINYHFGGKKKLYMAVLRHAWERANTLFPTDYPAGEEHTPEERLEKYISGRIHQAFSGDEASVFFQLMGHEIRSPSFAHEYLHEEFFRPKFRALQGVVTGLLPEGAPDENVRLCVHHILGLCHSFTVHRRIKERLMKRKPDRLPPPDVLTAQVVAFALGGLKAVGEMSGAAPDSHRSETKHRKRTRAKNGNQ